MFTNPNKPGQPVQKEVPAVCPEKDTLASTDRTVLLTRSAACEQDFITRFGEGDFKGAVDALKNQEAVLLQLWDHRTELATVSLNIGFLNFRLAEEDPSLAAVYLERAKCSLQTRLQEIAESNYPQASSDEIALKANLAHVLERTGELQQAEEILRALVDSTREGAVPNSHRKLSLELFYSRQGEAQKALALALDGFHDAVQRQESEGKTAEVAAYLSRIWRYYASVGDVNESSIWGQKYRVELESARSCLDNDFYESEMAELLDFIPRRTS